MAPNNDDNYPSHPSNLDQGFPAPLVEVGQLGLLNTTNLPRTTADDSVYAADAMVPLTDVGTVVGDQTVPATTQLQVLGPAVFDGTINSRGGVQFAGPGAPFGGTGIKRMLFDMSASLLLKLKSDLTEGIKAVLGDFTVTQGTLVAKSDSSSSGTLPITVNSGFNVWSRSTTFIENTLLSTDLPSYDGNFVISGTLSAHVTTVSPGFGGVQTRARVFASFDAGVTWLDQGAIGSCVNNGSAGSTTTSPFSGTFNLGTGTSIIIRIYSESYVRDIGDGGTGGGGGGVHPL